MSIRDGVVHGDLLLSTLFDLEYLEARCRASVAALLADLAYVLREAPAPLSADASFVHASGARLGRGAVAILETLLTVHRERLEHRPERLFPLLHDELYWYDAPARADHHDGSLAAIGGELWRWAEHARAMFEARCGAGWLRRLRPPRIADAALPSWRQPGEIRDLSGDGASAFVEARGELYLVDVRTGRVRARFAGADRGRFSADGSHLVTCSGTTATLWAADGRTALHVLGPHAGDIQRILFSRDGRVVFTMSTKQLRAWRVVDGSCVTRKTKDYVDALLPCGAGAVVFYERGFGWRRWDGATTPRRAAEDTGSYHVVAVSPAGDRLVQQRSDTGLVEGWELPAGKRLFQENTAFMMALAFHPEGACFAGTDGILRDATTGRATRRLGSSSPHPSFDPLGRFLLTRHDDGAWLWDLATGAVVARIAIRRIGDLRAHWSDDGRVLALAEIGHTVIVDLAALAPGVRWRDDAHPVGYYASARFSPTGVTLVVGHEDGIGFWDTARGVIRTFADAARYMGTFASGCCVLGRHDDTLIAFAIEDGVELWRTELPRGELESVYAADEVGVVLVEQMTPAQIVALRIEDGARCYQLAGERVVLYDRDVVLTRTSASDGVRLRATETGAVSLELPVQGDTFAISPDRRWLAACRGDIELWDLTTRTLHRTMTPRASSLSFRADSAALIARDSVTQQSGNQDWNVERIYDVATGACVSDRGWWDQDAEPAAPLELAPGIVLELPINPIVCRTEGGEVRVASVHGRRLELYAWKPGRVAGGHDPHEESNHDTLW